MILRHLADGDEHRLEPLGALAAARHRRPQRGPESLLVVAREQGEDLLPPEPAAMERRSREPGLVGDPGQRGRLPTTGGDRAASPLDHALLGGLDLCHRAWDDSVA